MFLLVSSLLIRFSLLFIALVLTVDTLMFFTISSQFSSVVATCLWFHMFILFCTIFLLVLLFFFLILLFNLSSGIVLIVPNSRFVRFVDLTWLLISLSFLIVYDCLRQGLIVFWISILVLVSYLNALMEDSVGDIRIMLAKHIIVGKIRKNTLSWLYWSIVLIFMSPLTSSEISIPINSV